MNLFDLVSGKDELIITLDLDDINESIRKIEGFEKLYKKAIYAGLQTASEKIKNKLASNMTRYGLQSLIPYMSVDYDLETITIQVTKVDENGIDYTTFIEYGTGITGAWSPHPYTPWPYDVNSHGYKGWWYPTTPDDPNPTKFVSKDGTLLAHTKGMPSRPFFYDTLNWIRAYNPIKREINKELRRIKV